MPDSDLDLAVLRLAWRIDAIDLWRTKVDSELDEIEKGLRAIVNEDQIEKAVRTAVRSEHTLGLTFVQKAGVVLVGIVTIAADLKGLIG